MDARDPFAPPTSDDPQKRLVAAAIEQIEKYGLAQLTVRAVAAAAGMNVAAVNYYFRSKDALVAAALEGTIRHMVADSEAFLQRLPEDPERVLGELLAYYLEGALRYPHISKAHLHDAFVSDDYEGAFTALFSPVMLRLRQALRKTVPGLGEKEAARRVVGALSAVFFPAFFLGFYRSLAALDTPADRASYAHEVALRSLAPPTARARMR
jgi:AcrR family transcriptional regulator